MYDKSYNWGYELDFSLLIVISVLIISFVVSLGVFVSSCGVIKFFSSFILDVFSFFGFLARCSIKFVTESQKAPSRCSDHSYMVCMAYPHIGSSPALVSANMISCVDSE